MSGPCAGASEAAGRPISTSAASAAAPASQRVALAGVGLQQRALEELAHDPEREPLLELRRPRARGPAKPRSDARARASSSSRDFPIPAAPSMTRAPPASLSRGAQRGADALDLVLALEQRGRLGEGGLVHAPIDRSAGAGRRAMFGGRCQGMCPMCGAPLGRTMAAPATARQGAHMSLIQVKLIEGVFTAPQKQEIIERLTDAMVEIEGESMRRSRGAWSRRSPAASGASAAQPSPPTTSRRSHAAIPPTPDATCPNTPEQVEVAHRQTLDRGRCGDDRGARSRNGERGRQRPGRSGRGRSGAIVRLAPPGAGSGRLADSPLPDGTARLAYPRRWRSIRSDPGTVSAALRSEKGRILGYLNATPQEGAETLSNWSSFRLDHNRDEGDVGVKLVASGTNLRFRGARGSCVIDDYRSSSGHGYRGSPASSPGQAQPPWWSGRRPPRSGRGRGRRSSAPYPASSHDQSNQRPARHKEKTMLSTLKARIAVALAVMGIVAAGSLPVAAAGHRHHHHHGIPQHNGGDHDADNNGGPSDGDGNV